MKQSPPKHKREFLENRGQFAKRLFSRFVFTFFGALLVFGLFSFLFYFHGKTSGNIQTQNISNHGKVCFDVRCFDVEIADSSFEHSIGLMNRESLDVDKGMIFVFKEHSAHSFWMKNTLIPLDIIWLDEDKSILYIHSNAQPCGEESCQSFGPSEPSRYVLEVNAGVADNIKLKAGQKADIQL